MFERRSRYYRLPDVVAPDAFGRPRAAKALRRLPLPSPRLLHTIDTSDRLDHLAYKYYRQSRRWWHIADANPAPLSPLALLGDGGERTALFTCEHAGAEPPLPSLLHALAHTPGVQDVVLPAEPPALTLADGGPLASLDPGLASLLRTAVLEQRLPAPLEAALAGAGIEFGTELRVAQLGPTSYALHDRVSGSYLRAQVGVSLELFAQIAVHRLDLRIDYNAFSVGEPALRAAIEAQGFAVVETRAQGRVGKPLLIPARVG